MAFPMVHLLIAHKWAQHKPELFDSPEYYLGTLAPDAIHMRENCRYPEDKYVTHLNALPEYQRDSRALLAYWRVRSTPFDLGYAIHVIGDVFWVRFYKETYPTLIVNGHTDNARYYPDANRIDDWLYEQREERPKIWALLARARAPEDHPLLSAPEIEGWRDRVFASFERALDLSLPKVFTRGDIGRFIEDAPADIDALLRDAAATQAYTPQ